MVENDKPIGDMPMERFVEILDRHKSTVQRSCFQVTLWICTLLAGARALATEIPIVTHS